MVGVTLFHRRTRKITLTNERQAAFPHGKRSSRLDWQRLNLQTTCGKMCDEILEERKIKSGHNGIFWYGKNKQNTASAGTAGDVGAADPGSLQYRGQFFYRKIF